MWKSGMPIAVGAGSHARPIRRSLKTEKNGINPLERQCFRRQHGTTKDNLGQLYYFIFEKNVVLCCPMLSNVVF